MRLSSEQVAAIKQETGHCIGVLADVRRSGSPVDGHQRGFTLVELITIIVILGIISVAALPRFLGNDVFQARGAADQVKSALRYGQKVAIAQRRTVSVAISLAASSDCGAVLTGGNVNCVISNSVSVPAKTVSFNALGQPVPNAADSITVGAPPNDTTINIAAETGYVH